MRHRRPNYCTTIGANRTTVTPTRDTTTRHPPHKLPPLRNRSAPQAANFPGRLSHDAGPREILLAAEDSTETSASISGRDLRLSKRFPNGTALRSAAHCCQPPTWISTHLLASNGPIVPVPIVENGLGAWARSCSRNSTTARETVTSLAF